MTDENKTTWMPQFSPWRHGGWYVDNIRYPSGACGCVSRNFPDRKWRIVCDDRPGSGPGGSNDRTYANRDAAARAERALVEALWVAERVRITYPTYRVIADALPADVLRDASRNGHIDVTLRVALADALRAQ
jgi:hypothetical protein